jgi:hypothetical protein
MYEHKLAVGDNIKGISKDKWGRYPPPNPILGTNTRHFV